MAKTPTFRQLFKKRATDRQIEIIKTPSTQLRSVTKAEKLAHPDKFSPKGRYLVPKSVKKIGTRTTFVRLSDKQDWNINLHHTKAAKLRAEGRLGYGPRGTERGIPKSVITRRLRHSLTTVQWAEKPATPQAQRKKHRGAKRYPVTDEMRASFWDLRTRKLAGEFLDDGDWHQLIDMSRAMHDPMLNALLRSP